MNKKRPINLDLTTIHFPLPAIVSILHRLSGVFLFILIPVLLCLLSKSLQSAVEFAYVRNMFTSVGAKLFLLFSLAALLYHLCAGVRHVLMDMGWGETIVAARLSAMTLFIIVAGLTFWAGVWLW